MIVVGKRPPPLWPRVMFANFVVSFVKQEKGIKTAILSNDKNLCYRAVVYGKSGPFSAELA